MVNSIHHVAIICSDYQTSKYFYTSILGIEGIAENYRKPLGSYKLDLKLPNGGQIELFSFPKAPNRPSYPEALDLRHLAFNVESVEGVIDFLVSKGIEVEPIRIDDYTRKNIHFLTILMGCY